MLHEFIKANRELLLSRCAKLSAEKGWHNGLQTSSLGHVSVFFDQLVAALQVEHGNPGESGGVGEKTVNPAPAVQLSKSAFDHGQELRESNLSIGSVVRSYGNVCQDVTGYAIEVNAAIEPAEFRTLNWCLDEAIAQAVTAFTAIAPTDAAGQKASGPRHGARLDNLAMMASHLERIINAVTSIRSGRVGVAGATAALLDESLKAMQDLIEQSANEQF